MSSVIDNKKLVQKFNEACIKKDNEFLSEHIDDNIKWNIVGMPNTYGKKYFFETMKIINSASDGCDNLIIKKIIAEENYVVVESSDQKGIISYCNIFQIRKGKIIEITTYVVDITSG